MGACMCVVIFMFFFSIFAQAAITSVVCGVHYKGRLITYPHLRLWRSLCCHKRAASLSKATRKPSFLLASTCCYIHFWQPPSSSSTTSFSLFARAICTTMYKSAMCSDPRRIPPINPQSKCFANNTHIFQIAFLNVKISLQNTINNSQFVFVFLFLRIFISCVYRRIRCYMSCIHINRRFCSTYSHQTGWIHAAFVMIIVAFALIVAVPSFMNISYLFVGLI